jgi:hypothetical protein
VWYFCKTNDLTSTNASDDEPKYGHVVDKMLQVGPLELELEMEEVGMNALTNAAEVLRRSTSAHSLPRAGSLPTRC